MSRVVIRPAAEAPVVVTTTYVIRTVTGGYVLPDAATVAGREYVIKASGATVTVTSAGGTIDGQATLVVDDPNSATLYSNGTNWFII